MFHKIKLLALAGMFACAGVAYADATGPVTPLGGGGGTVSSVGLTSTGGTITISGAPSPITLSGTYNVDIPTGYLASPPAIGGTAPAAGSFTNLTVTGAATIPGQQTTVLQSSLPFIYGPSGYLTATGAYVIGQAPTSSATASFSATSGTGVTMTMSAATLLGTASDVGRVLTILDTTYKYAEVAPAFRTRV